MQQIIERIDSYEYIITTFSYESDKQVLDGLIDEAAELAGIVNPFGPDGRLRSTGVRFNKNLGGLLAERAFREYVDGLINKKNLNVRIKEISELKEEVVGNISWNQIDLILEVNGMIKTMEIRSSFSYKTSLRRLFGFPLINDKGAFSIIGWYTHTHKPIEEKKDYYIFCIHYYHPDNILVLCQDEIEVYIAGAASKETLEKKGYNSDLKQRGASFRIINPLRSVPDPVKVINDILEIDK